MSEDELDQEPESTPGFAPATVYWPPGCTEQRLWRDLSRGEKRDYSAWKKEQAAIAAREACLQSVADILVANGKRVRAERGQAEPLKRKR